MSKVNLLNPYLSLFCFIFLNVNAAQTQLSACLVKNGAVWEGVKINNQSICHWENFSSCVCITLICYGHAGGTVTENAHVPPYWSEKENMIISHDIKIFFFYHIYIYRCPCASVSYCNLALNSILLIGSMDELLFITVTYFPTQLFILESSFWQRVHVPEQAVRCQDLSAYYCILIFCWWVTEMPHLPSC